MELLQFDLLDSKEEGEAVPKTRDAKGVECLAVQVIECRKGVKPIFDEGKAVLF
jgi:hypothetical protein